MKDPKRKRIHKAQLRTEERLRNRIKKLARDVQERAARCEALTKGQTPGTKAHRIAETLAEMFREFAGRCEVIAELAALPADDSYRPVRGERQILYAYYVQKVREADPRASYQQIADLLSQGQGQYIDGDTLRKATDRTRKRLGADALAPGSPLRYFVEGHLETYRPRSAGIPRT
ncbi:MAG TPA: hypothetical protein VKV79_02995 [Terriglobia bacterium]|nr:hypothetical protein [Terriglobia bacterium]